MTHLGLILIILLLSSGIFGQPSRTQVEFENSVTTARNGDHFNALSGFRRSLSHARLDRASDEYLARIHFNIGVCLFRLDRPSDAIAEFREAIGLNNRYARVYYSLGRAEMETANWNAAEAAFLRGLSLNERNGEAWFDLAFVYIAKKDHEAARTAFENALRHGTQDAAISHNNLGVLAAMKGEIDNAVKAFQLAIKASDGKLTVANDNLAICKAIRSDRGRSVAKLELSRGER